MKKDGATKFLFLSLIILVAWIIFWFQQPIICLVSGAIVAVVDLVMRFKINKTKFLDFAWIFPFPVNFIAIIIWGIFK